MANEQTKDLVGEFSVGSSPISQKDECLTGSFLCFYGLMASLSLSQRTEAWGGQSSFTLNCTIRLLLLDQGIYVYPEALSQTSAKEPLPCKFPSIRASAGTILTFLPSFFPFSSHRNNRLVLQPIRPRGSSLRSGPPSRVI